MRGRYARPSESFAPASSITRSDVLSDVLQSVRLSGALFFPMEASSPWADSVPPSAALADIVLPGAQHVVSYHVVVAGRCWLALEGQSSVRLETGDIVLIPHGDAYVMSDAAGARSEASVEATLAFFRQMSAGTVPSVVIEGGGGAERASIVCGFLACDIHPFNPVLQTLPRLVHLRRGASDSSIALLLDLAFAESRRRRPGAQAVLVRLSEVLFVEVIRRYIESLDGDQTGWLAGLRDPIAGRALALLHDRTSHSWTLEELAATIGTSRSALAARFTHFLGEPPMHYLARWRMQCASRLLSDAAGKVAAVALAVGYRSESAFSRAFKKLTGTSPAEWRRRSSARN